MRAQIEVIDEEEEGDRMIDPGDIVAFYSGSRQKGHTFVVCGTASSAKHVQQEIEDQVLERDQVLESGREVLSKAIKAKRVRYISAHSAHGLTGKRGAVVFDNHALVELFSQWDKDKRELIKLRDMVRMVHDLRSKAK
jgi:hypothetical protein